jgi:hypothetical protein
VAQRICTMCGGRPDREPAVEDGIEEKKDCRAMLGDTRGGTKLRRGERRRAGIARRGNRLHEAASRGGRKVGCVQDRAPAAGGGVRPREVAEVGPDRDRAGRGRGEGSEGSEALPGEGAEGAPLTEGARHEAAAGSTTCPARSSRRDGRSASAARRGNGLCEGGSRLRRPPSERTYGARAGRG